MDERRERRKGNGGGYKSCWHFPLSMLFSISISVSLLVHASVRYRASPSPLSYSANSILYPILAISTHIHLSIYPSIHPSTHHLYTTAAAAIAMSSCIKSPTWFHQPSTVPFSPSYNSTCRISDLSEIKFPDADPYSPTEQSSPRRLECARTIPPTTPDEPEERGGTGAISGKNLHFEKPALKVGTGSNTQPAPRSENTASGSHYVGLPPALKDVSDTKPAGFQGRPSRFCEGPASSVAPPNMEALKVSIPSAPPQKSKHGWGWVKGKVHGA